MHRGEGMHWKRVDQAALKYSGCKHGELLVLRAIIRHCDQYSNAWPGTDLLATITQLSRRRVQQCIRSLESKGYLYVTTHCEKMDCRNKRGQPIWHHPRFQHFAIERFPGEPADFRLPPHLRLTSRPRKRRQQAPSVPYLQEVAS